MIGRKAIVSLLEACRSARQAKQIHAHMTATAVMKDIILLSKLVDFCADVRDLDYARSIFLRIEIPSVFIWNSMIRAFSASERHGEALSMYREMQRLGYNPDNFTFPFVLRSCAATSDRLLCGAVHSRSLRSGYVADLYVSTSLVHGYAVCREIQSAQVVFDEMPHRNVVTWTTMISGYANAGRAGDAVRLLKEMELAGVEANPVTMVNVLAACAKTRDLELGRWALRRLHLLGSDQVKSNVVLATAVVDMYARCGRLRTARQLFDTMPQRNLSSWNAMITAYNQYERWDEAMELFREMRGCGVMPDKVTLLGLLTTCAQSGYRILGQGIHAHLEKKGYSEDIQVQTAISQMYAKSGDSRSAFQIFRSLQRKDVVAWTGMINVLGSHGQGHEAMDLFEEMKKEGIPPDGIAFIAILSACSHSGLVEEGHRYFDAMESVHGISPNLQHYGCVVDLLSRAGRIAEAERLVESMPARPSAAVWSAMLSGCRIHGAVEIAERLGQRIEEFSPTSSGAYLLLSNLYAAGGRWDEVHFVRASMRENGVEKSLPYCRVGA